MVKGYSKAILMGNLTRDPETRATSTGASVTAFGVAVNRSYKSASGEMVEDVSFFDCSAWGKVGETIAKYAHRGSGILLSGRLSQRSWTDEKSGQKRTRAEITVEDFTFVGGNGDMDTSSGGGSSYTPAAKPAYKSSESKSGDNKKAPASASASASASEDVLPDEVDMNGDTEIDLEGVPF